MGEISFFIDKSAVQNFKKFFDNTLTKDDHTWFPLMAMPRVVSNHRCSLSQDTRSYTRIEEYPAKRALIIDILRTDANIPDYKICACLYLFNELHIYEGERHIGDKEKADILVFHSEFFWCIIDEGNTFEDFNNLLLSKGVAHDEEYSTKMLKLFETIDMLNKYDDLAQQRQIAEQIRMVDLFTIRHRTSIFGGDHGNENIRNAIQTIKSYLKRHNLVRDSDLRDDDMVSFDDKMITSYNPANCTLVDKDPLFLIDFKDMTLADMGTWSNFFSTGRCYTYEYIALELINGMGVLPWMTNPSYSDNLLFTRSTIPKISKFYADPINIDAKGRLADVWSTLSNDIKHIMNLDVGLPNNESDWQAFFLAIYTKLDTTTRDVVVGKAFAIGGITTLNVLALLGFTMLADDLSVFNNTDGSKFNISQYCLSEFTDYVEALNKLGYMDDLKALRYGKTTLANVIDEIDSTCIHGTGARMISIYISSFASLRNMDVSLCPVLIQTPSRLLQNLGAQNKLEYLTCIRYDAYKSTINSNPLNSQYIVRGFKSDGTSKYLFSICTSHKDKGSTFQPQGHHTLEDYFIKGNGNCIFIPYIEKDGPTSFEPAMAAAFFSLPENHTHLVDLMRIPYLFQKERKITFKIYKEYALHVARLQYTIKQGQAENTVRSEVLGSKARQYKKWAAKMLEEEVFNIETGDNERPSVETFIAFLGDKRFMLNTDYDDNTNTSNSEQVSLVGNIIKLEYVHSGLVKEPTTNKTITRTYQYMTLLSKVMYSERYLRHVMPTTTMPINQAFSDNAKTKEQLMLLERYYRMFYQEFTASTHVFDIVDGVYFNGNQIHRKELNEHSIITTLRNHMRRKEANVDISTAYTIITRLQNLSIYSLESFLDSLPDSVQINVQLSNDFILQINTYDMRVSVKKTAAFLAFLYFICSLEYADKSIGQPHTNLGIDYTAATFEYFQMLRLKSNVRASTVGQKNLDPTFIDLLFKVLSIPLRHMSQDIHSPSAFQYHFTEIMRDAYFLETMDALLATNTMDPAYSDFHMISNTNVQSQSFANMIAKYNKTLDFLNTKIAYFNKDEGDMAVPLTLNDYQDSVHVRFEYLMKAHMLSKHRLRLLQCFSVINGISMKLIDPQSHGLEADGEVSIDVLFELYFNNPNIFAWYDPNNENYMKIMYARTRVLYETFFNIVLGGLRFVNQQDGGRPLRKAKNKKQTTQTKPTATAKTRKINAAKKPTQRSSNSAINFP